MPQPRESFTPISWRTTADFGPVLLRGETLESWRREIEALRSAVDLWRAMLKGREELVSALKRQFGDFDKLPIKVTHLLHLDDQDPAMAALSTIQRGASNVLQRELDLDFLFGMCCNFGGVGW